MKRIAGGILVACGLIAVGFLICFKFISSFSDADDLAHIDEDYEDEFDDEDL